MASKDVYKAEEVRGWDEARLKEAEGEIRRELSTIRMDIYRAPSSNVARVNKLKLNLARILTVATEKKKTTKKKATGAN